MKITTTAVGHGPVPGTQNTQFAVSVEFDESPINCITFSVTIASAGAPQDQETRAIAKAKKLARAFADQA